MIELIHYPRMSMWFFLSNFRIKNKHFFACMQILTNQRIISWKKQMVSNLIRKITCSSWDNESIQSRQIYDVIILVHQTEIGTFLSPVQHHHHLLSNNCWIQIAFHLWLLQWILITAKSVEALKITSLSLTSPSISLPNQMLNKKQYILFEHQNKYTFLSIFPRRNFIDFKFFQQ